MARPTREGTFLYIYTNDKGIDYLIELSTGHATALGFTAATSVQTSTLGKIPNHSRPRKVSLIFAAVAPSTIPKRTEIPCPTRDNGNFLSGGDVTVDGETGSVVTRIGEFWRVGVLTAP